MKTQIKVTTCLLVLALTGFGMPHRKQVESRDEAVARAVKAIWPYALVCVESPTSAKAFHGHALYSLSYTLAGNHATLSAIERVND
jgi:hypothetical protein